VSLRSAKFNDHWKTSFKRNYSERVGGLSISDSTKIANTSLSFEKGVIALVGGNGAGKSTLAHAVAEGLFTESLSEDLLAQTSRISGTVISFDIEIKGASSTRRVSFANEGKVIEGEQTICCNWLDPSLFATKCRQQIYGDKSFNDILDGFSPKIFSADDLALASYVVGKTYYACKVWEVTEYGPFDVWPYFKVNVNGAEYGSESMGQGEVSLLSAIWMIKRCADNSLMIIEEPETHVSPRSQVALMDLIARESAMRGVSFIVTTHSPVVLSKLPPSNIYLLLSNGVKSDVINSPKQHHIASLLGGGTSYRHLLIVEDPAAKALCDGILGALDQDLARQVVYSITKDGESEIVKILETMPCVKEWGMLVGCFDGDQRDIYGGLTMPWPHIFLPTRDAPDLLLKEYLIASDKSKSAEKMGINKLDLLVAIEAADGSDHHDWVRHVASSLNISSDDVFKALTSLWLEENLDLGYSFLEELRNALA